MSYTPLQSDRLAEVLDKKDLQRVDRALEDYLAKLHERWQAVELHIRQYERDDRKELLKASAKEHVKLIKEIAAVEYLHHDIKMAQV